MEDERNPTELPHELPIAVYGTLRPGCGNDQLWKGLAEPIDDSNLLIFGYRLVSFGAFPYAIPDPDEVSIGCLLVARPGCWPELIRRCDRLEGVPVHYIREEALVQRANHTTEFAWIYTPAGWEEQRGWRNREPRQVPLNDWAKWRNLMAS
jgi:gamma-glutamylcyclotransferase (GGCT)/AIG2-like uncharacterized protein YtfP